MHREFKWGFSSPIYWTYHHDIFPLTTDTAAISNKWLKSFRSTKDLLFRDNLCPSPTANHVTPVSICFVSAVRGQVSGGVLMTNCHYAMVVSWFTWQPLLGRLSEKASLCFCQVTLLYCNQEGRGVELSASWIIRKTVHHFFISGFPDEHYWKYVQG